MLEKEKSIIIISTTLSICIMLLTGIDKSNETVVINKSANIKNKTEIIIDRPKMPTEASTSGSLGKIDESKPSIASKNKKESVVVAETKKPIEEKKNTESSKVAENNIKSESVPIQSPSESSIENENTEETASVFKVNREDIYSELSFYDKEKLILISTKLKIVDYQKINNLLQGDTDGTGVLSSLRILKDRLSKNDYSKIKEIFSKFINMDLV